MLKESLCSFFQVFFYGSYTMGVITMQNHQLGEYVSIFFQPPRLGEYSCWDDIWEIPKVLENILGECLPLPGFQSYLRKG